MSDSHFRCRKGEQGYPQGVLKLIKDARNTPVSSGMSSCDMRQCPSSGYDDKGATCVLPPWLDPKALKDGQRFVARHFFLIFFSHFISLILLLSYVPVRRVLVKTGKSHTKELALKRYLSTLSHVKLWYESDLSAQGSVGVRDVLKVRRIHGGVSKRVLEEKVYGKPRSQPSAPSPVMATQDSKAIKTINALEKYNCCNERMTACDMNNNDFDYYDLSCLSTPPPIPPSSPITQLDMIVTQYCFMGLLTSFPQKFGVLLSSSSCKEDIEGLEGFTHIWAVIGYLLGIEDQFNLCLGDSLQDKKAMKDFILKEILLKDLSITNLESYRLWNALVSAMSTFVPCLSINASLLYILDHTLELKGSPLYWESTLYERFCFHLKILLFNSIFIKITRMRSVFNELLRLAIYLTELRLSLVKVIVCAK